MVNQLDDTSPPTQNPSPRKGGVVVILILMLFSIAAIWYYAINRHLHLQANKRNNLAGRFSEHFLDFYDNLGHAADVFFASNESFVLAEVAGKTVTPETRKSLTTSLDLMAVLSDAEMVVVSDATGRPVITSENPETSFYRNHSLLINPNSSGNQITAGVRIYEDPDSHGHYLVVTPRALYITSGQPEGWLSFLFTIDEAMKRTHGIDDKINLVDSGGEIIFSATNLPNHPNFKDRISKGIWRSKSGNNISTPAVVSYDTRLEFGYSILPGGDLAAITPMPGAMDDYLLLGALLTVVVVGTMPIMLRVHSNRERAKQEEQRLRYYVAEIENAKKEAERANLSKSEFLANISHEIRTLMNGVTGMLDLLSRTRLTEKQREYCDIIKASTNSLLSVINDILDFTKMEAGKMGIEKAPFDLQATAVECLRLFSSRAEEQGNELVFDYDPGLPTHVMGDIFRLRQIIANLVSNAIKFTNGGTVILSFTGMPLDADRTLFTIRISDTGVGIAADEQSRIFDKFEQADPSIARRFGGTGLGLAICQRLVTLMGGEIHCFSQLGEGSTFTVTLPLVCEQRGNGRLPEGPKPSWTGALAILYEPNESLREVMVRRFISLDFRAVGVATPEAVLQTAEEHAERTTQTTAPIFVLANTCKESTMALVDRIRSVDGGFPAPIVIASYPAAGEELPPSEPGIGYDLLLSKPLWQKQILKACHALYKSHAQVRHHGTATAIPTDYETGPGTEKRILLVDDNTVNQIIVSGILQKHGYRVEMASNGVEALHMAANTSYDAILMDCQMPEMGGIEATRRIRLMEKSALEDGDPRIPIIALSAGSMEIGGEDWSAAGMDAFISKPVSPDELLATLQHLITHLQ